MFWARKLVWLLTEKSGESFGALAGAPPAEAGAGLSLQAPEHWPPEHDSGETVHGEQFREVINIKKIYIKCGNIEKITSTCLL